MSALRSLFSRTEPTLSGYHVIGVVYRENAWPEWILEAEPRRKQPPVGRRRHDGRLRKRVEVVGA